MKKSIRDRLHQWGGFFAFLLSLWPIPFLCPVEGNILDARCLSQIGICVQLFQGDTQTTQRNFDLGFSILWIVILYLQNLTVMLKKGILFTAFLMALGLGIPHVSFSQNPNPISPGSVEQGIIHRILYDASTEYSQCYGESYSCQQLELLFNRGTVQIFDLGETGNTHSFEVVIDTNPVIVILTDTGL